MDEVYPAFFKDYYILLTPVMRWICFGINLFSILCILSILHIHKATVPLAMRFFLFGIILHLGSVAFAIMQGAQLFISPFSLIGFSCMAGCAAYTVLGKTGIFSREAEEPIVQVKVRQEFILNPNPHHDSHEVLD
jgi:hypothetical protein